MPKLPKQPPVHLICFNPSHFNTIKIHNRDLTPQFSARHFCHLCNVRVLYCFTDYTEVIKYVNPTKWPLGVD